MFPQKEWGGTLGTQGCRTLRQVHSVQSGLDKAPSLGHAPASPEIMCLVDNSSTSPLGIQQPGFDRGWIRVSCELKSIRPMEQVDVSPSAAPVCSRPWAIRSTALALCWVSSLGCQQAA